MSQDPKADVSKDLTGIKSVGQSASTPPAQPANPANVPAAVNAGSPSPTLQNSATPEKGAASKPEEKAITPVNTYIPGGLNPQVLNPVVNPAQSDKNFPFSAGHNMHEVAQYQNFFTFPLDTYYNIFDAINYFSDENNRDRYTYEQQQIIISRIVRAAQDFGIPIEGIRDKLKN
ncbi:MAG TPA: hypothetical protein VH186_22500 [Chloroflexia bacterium]|nr:hypothetical protein [Chloroflexia bacterium]